VKWTTIVFDNADTEIHILSFKDIQLYIVIYTLRETKLIKPVVACADKHTE